MHELGFLFHCHQGDYRLAYRLAKEIRQHYPDAPAICIGDGFRGAELLALLEELNIRFTFSERPLKTPMSGWKWTERFLQVGAALGCDYFLRLDTDTRLHRPVTNIPEADMFGQLSKKGGPPWPYIGGGCIGVKSSAAGDILRSGILRDSFYANPNHFAYARYNAELSQPGERISNKAYYLDDIALGHVATKMGLTMANWPEVLIKFRGRPKVGNRAITHPWPVAEKVFGIGLPRTGTLSLTEALKTLGYHAQHWPGGKGVNDCQQLLQRAEQFDALTDHPARACYRGLLKTYPDAFFVLGDRTPADWVRSMNRNFNAKEIRNFVDNHGPLMDWWEGHRAEVVEFFEAQGKSDQLLLHNPADGWGPLCRLLGRTVPDIEYPHLHKRRQVG